MDHHQVGTAMFSELRSFQLLMLGIVHMFVGLPLLLFREQEGKLARSVRWAGRGPSLYLAHEQAGV